MRDSVSRSARGIMPLDPLLKLPVYGQFANLKEYILVSPYNARTRALYKSFCPAFFQKAGRRRPSFPSSPRSPRPHYMHRS